MDDPDDTGQPREADKIVGVDERKAVEQEADAKPEQWAEDYAVEKLGGGAPRAARDVVRDAFLAGYLVRVLKSSDPRPSGPRLQLSQALTPEVLRGFRAMTCALTAPQAEHPDVRAACEWLAAGSVPAGDQVALDSPPCLSPEQGAALSRYFHSDGGEFQRRVVRGDEDDHLAEMIDAFDAFFVMCRAKLGHDRVPIGIWETYMMIKRRNALVGGSHG